MPCPVCKLSFNVNPCEHQTGIITLDTKESIVEHITPVLTSYLKGSTLNKFMEALYLQLHNNCPCIECLVKVMCTEGHACEKYNKLLHNLKKIADKGYQDKIVELEKDPKNECITKLVSIPGVRGKTYEYKSDNIETEMLSITYYNVQVMVRLKGGTKLVTPFSNPTGQR